MKVFVDKDAPEVLNGKYFDKNALEECMLNGFPTETHLRLPTNRNRKMLLGAAGKPVIDTEKRHSVCKELATELNRLLPNDLREH